MEQYLSLLREVLENGEEKGDRTGTGTIALFGMQRKYDLREGFPLVTTKKVKYEAILRELLWFLHGATNIHDDDLTDHTPIWDAWADEAGNLGPIYGYQWRKWERYTRDPKTGTCSVAYIDQMQRVIDALKEMKTNSNHPLGRRLIVSAWNVADLDRMALWPCHAFFQFSVTGNRIDMQMYQRSADLALGVPYNIASYATLLMMVALECGYEPGIFTHTLGDVHIYRNHIEGVREQLTRKPYPLPKLTIRKRPFDDYGVEDFRIEGYTHHPFIRFPVAV